MARTRGALVQEANEAPAQVPVQVAPPVPPQVPHQENAPAVPPALDLDELADLDAVQGRMIELFARATAEQRAQYIQLIQDVNLAVAGPIDGVEPVPQGNYFCFICRRVPWCPSLLALGAIYSR